MPQTAYTAVFIRKWMNQLKFVMKHTAADQHMHIAAFHPVQQLHDQIRDILRQRPKMQDTPFLIYNAHRQGAEHS